MPLGGVWLTVQCDDVRRMNHSENKNGFSIDDYFH